MLRPIHQMLPHEIIARRERSSCAFIPISPIFEWHSFHLPVGTDALIAEGIAAAVAEAIGGVYFPSISMGLDEYRSQDQLLAWGFAPTDRVYGMRFPELPLSSEYCRQPEMVAAIENRLKAVRLSGFRFAFLINNHGGAGQIDLLAETARRQDRPEFRVFSVATYDWLRPLNEHMKIGGHAGQSETLILMAFRPELVDFTQLPSGELSVRREGILHHRPTIEEEYHPSHVTLATANEIRKMIVEGFVAFVNASRAGQQRTAK